MLTHLENIIHLLAMGGPLLLPILGVDSLVVATPGKLTYRFQFVSTPNEITVGIGPAVFGVGGFLGLVSAFGRAYRRGTRPRQEAI